MRRAAILTLALLAGPAVICIPAQDSTTKSARELGTAAKFELTVDSIMRGPALVGWPPSALRWSADSRTLFFDWRKPGEDEASTYAVGRDGGEPRKLSEEEARNAPPASGRWDQARSRAIFTDRGDVVMYDARSGRRVHITRTTGAESNARWARNDTHVTFVRDGNLFVVPVMPSAGGETAAVITQLTDVKSRRPEPRQTESQRFLAEEEAKLIERVREQKEEKKKSEEKTKKDSLPDFELLDRQSAIDLMVSPDETYAFLLVSERPAGAKSTVVPNYVTESAYTEDIPARTNVGDAQERRLLAVLNLKTRKSVWADASFAQPVSESDQPAAPGAAGSDAKPGRKAEREVRWSMPVISDDGQQVVASARSTDNKDRWFVTLDPESGKTRVVDTLHDEAWVREASLSGGTLQFLPDDRRVAFLSERDGWMHLYTLDVSSSDAKPSPLTSGKWEVTAVELSTDRKKFYITTTEQHPGERHLYSLPLDGGPRTKITSMTGSNEAEVSPDESTLGLVHSYSTRPPEVYLMPNRPGADARQVTTTPTAEWRSHKWIDPKVITYKARDGVDVSARLFTPDMSGLEFDKKPGAKWKAVVFVHGAGYLQNAHKYWSTYYREYMFHNLLAHRGYVVLDVDYRASSGYGRDWRTAIYRHMGGKDLEDIVDGAKYLVANQEVDPKRIGVYGGSYGGFITLMAMFTTPDVFAAGAALRPVTDWAHYNHSYTSSILNVPQKDAEAYRKSSPIYFAAGLKGALLICHGMVDTNVHFQDSVRLAQRLIELRKENWELAVYPVENHGFTEETSWADEYKRILKLFDTMAGRKT
jgi:dipeptidyl aminopeptidase/acylaminoacyl peptidase